MTPEDAAACDHRGQQGHLTWEKDRMAGGVGGRPSQSTQKFGPGDLNRRKGETRSLGFTSWTCGPGLAGPLLVLEASRQMAALTTHVDSRREPEARQQLLSRLRLHKTDWDGAGILGIVLGFGLFGYR